ncbi:LacI family DNA-binding transcriptional regulator [Mycetocola zhujimingii]|uniref:LacI family transcriptional regulator n=1 Tax=Mycetocola zhujimingii TaxID=2079792 RepID=A0A2U1TAD6_9MICO|nr:substrate-binding domain-containing protein [Mycetocola zhujimingii]AWB85452.1 LacI family transcriptional regulator [Mycetocola zhujimingii]PWC04638.1 LacI family transcriptional regulator [Mycetocola zhujimingii]
MILSPGSRATTDAVGLCLHQPRRRVSLEPFWMQFLQGAEDVLAESGKTLLLAVVADLSDEVATLRRWHETGQVVGVILSDLASGGDERLELLREIEMPAVVLAQPMLAPGFATISTDNARSIREVVEFLAAGGHRSIGRVSGPKEFMHTLVRDEAFRSAGERLGIDTVSVWSDYTADGGAEATVELLERPDRPTAVIYDNDLMALAGLETVTSLGLSVPGDVAILAWDDSVHCQLASPPISALMHDLVAYGADTARVLLDVLNGVPEPSRVAEQPHLVARESTRVVRDREPEGHPDIHLQG